MLWIEAIEEILFKIGNCLDFWFTVLLIAEIKEINNFHPLLGLSVNIDS